MLKGENLYSMLKANSLLRVKLFRTHSVVLNTTIFLMQKLGEMKIQCPEKILVDHVNINSARSKFHAPSFIIDTDVDILLISETKLDESFPSAKLRLKGFCTPYKLDRNSKRGGFLLYFHENIPSRFLNSGSECKLETISVAINLRKRKWLLTSCYNPYKSLILSLID